MPNLWKFLLLLFFAAIFSIFEYIPLWLLLMLIYDGKQMFFISVSLSMKKVVISDHQHSKGVASWKMNRSWELRFCSWDPNMLWFTHMWHYVNLKCTYVFNESEQVVITFFQNMFFALFSFELEFRLRSF